MNVEYGSPLVMHMLVLHGNIGSKIDISRNGYIVDKMAIKFPESRYIAPIEEHNIHAIFKWECILKIQIADARLSQHAKNDDAANFLKCTELTVSITRLGTCIYRIGSKIRSESEDTDAFKNNMKYSDDTEDFIIAVCCHIHDMIAGF